MRFTSRHLTILLISFAVLIVSTYVISVIAEGKVYRNYEMEMKNETNILEHIMRHRNRGKGEAYYRDDYSFRLESGIYRRREEDGIKGYLATADNYKDVFGRYHLKGIEKLYIEPNYQTKLPIEHVSLMGDLPVMKQKYSANVFVLAKNGKIINYQLIDGRLADFSQVEGEQIDIRYYTVKMDSSGRMVFYPQEQSSGRAVEPELKPAVVE